VEARRSRSSRTLHDHDSPTWKKSLLAAKRRYRRRTSRSGKETCKGSPASSPRCRSAARSTDEHECCRSENEADQTPEDVRMREISSVRTSALNHQGRRQQRHDGVAGGCRGSWFGMKSPCTEECVAASGADPRLRLGQCRFDRGALKSSFRSIATKEATGRPFQE